MMKQSNQTDREEAGPARSRRPRRTHRAGAARFGAGVLRERRYRRRHPGGRRRPAPGQSASAHPDGRPDRGGRSLSKLADAERHHSRIGEPQRRHPRRARSARQLLRRRHARHRHRPHERRHALSRTGAPRRQRLSDFAGRRACRSCARCADCFRRPTPSRSAASSPWSAPRAASAPPPSPTISASRSRTISSSTRS